jgi:hypothetical protein
VGAKRAKAPLRGYVSNARGLNKASLSGEQKPPPAPAVKAAGIPWWEAHRGGEAGESSGSLDLTAYRDEKDFLLLRRLVRKEKEK